MPSLKGVVLDDEDYKVVFLVMKRSSERSGNDTAAANNMPLPKIEDLMKEVTTLADYCYALRKLSRVRKKRKKLEQRSKAVSV